MITLKAGAVVYPTAVLDGDVEIGFNSVVLSGESPEKITRIMSGSIIGANATIYEGITLGRGCRVMPGSVVRQSVPPLAIVVGNPASIVGYENTAVHGLAVAVSTDRVGSVSTSVRGVQLFKFSNIADMRGNLTVGEFERQIPFSPMRDFVVHGVPTAETRGEHAHIQCHQFLIALGGSVNVIADDGERREEFVLDRNNLGLYLPPMTWGIQYRYSTDAVLLVFASDFYDPDDYIRDYEGFIEKARSEVASAHERGD